jgi:hypothetical protein
MSDLTSSRIASVGDPEPAVPDPSAKKGRPKNRGVGSEKTEPAPAIEESADDRHNLDERA